MVSKNLTYKKSGVNIAAADNFVKFISQLNTNKKGKKKLSNIGGFGSITPIPKKFNNPQIVACTDGVGTKIEIANTLNKFNTIGIDLVAMSVNDLIVQGATPLIFLDYISINKVNSSKLKSVIPLPSVNAFVNFEAVISPLNDPVNEPLNEPVPPVEVPLPVAKVSNTVSTAVW